ncbi:hypothetical protein ABK040_015645 [Willaertia magna]
MSQESTFFHPEHHNHDFGEHLGEEQLRVYNMFFAASTCGKMIAQGESTLVRQMKQEPFTKHQHELLRDSCTLKMLHKNNACLSSNIFHKVLDPSTEDKLSWQMNQDFLTKNKEGREEIFNEVDHCLNFNEDVMIKQKEVTSLIRNDWQEPGSFSRVFPDMLKVLSKNTQLRFKAINWISKINNNKTNKYLDKLCDEFYPQEKQELVNCIRENVHSRKDFHYQTFLEDCKVPIQQFYFKMGALVCKNTFSKCLNYNLEEASLVDAMNCSVAADNEDGNNCQHTMLKYFEKVISDNVPSENV